MADKYRSLAEEQAAASLQNVLRQLQANRVDQYTPWGQTTWDRPDPTDPDGIWSQRTEFSPEQADIFKRQQDIQRQRAELAAQMMERSGERFGTPVDFSNAPSFGSAPKLSNFKLDDLRRFGRTPNGLTGMGDPLNRIGHVPFDPYKTKYQPEPYPPKDHPSRNLANTVPIGDYGNLNNQERNFVENRLRQRINRFQGDDQMTKNLNHRLNMLNKSSPTSAALRGG